MSIVAYSGLPGSGKSYGVVENVIIPALEAGRTVLTNVSLRVGYLSDDFPNGRIIQFDSKEPEENPNFFNLETLPPGVIIVIDEAWRYWKSGMKSTNIPQVQKEFFTEHRHVVGPDGHTNEIVLVTQDLSQLCMFVRSLVEETYRAVKLTAVGQRNKYRVDVFMGAATGQKPGKPMRQLYGKYKPEVYKYYKSHTRNKTDFAAGMEEKADDRANVLKSPFIKYGMPAAVLLMVWGVYQAIGYFTQYGDDESSNVDQSGVTTGQVVQAVQTVSGAVSRPVARPVSAGRAEYQSRFEIEDQWLPVSDKWRIVGEVNGVYWIWGETGTRRIHSRMCARIVKTGEPYCVIGGKLVTYYSFREPNREVVESEATSYDLSPGGSDGV